ncbi:MAG TPA: cytochrome P450 [Acidimicrobiales bacterium]|nr:cytochrome P450 [Acidimicrobiales bacterium]
MSREGDKDAPVHFDRHTPDYIDHFSEITRQLHARCPIAWTDTYGGHWVASGYKEVFEIARNATLLSNDHDPKGERKGYQGISIPGYPGRESRGGFLEMDPPEQRDYRRALDPYLSPAAVARWRPMIEDLTRACLDERIETGSIDFVDDLANVVPAVMTLALMGLPLVDWVVYCEPAHAQVYTPPDSPDMARVMAMTQAMVDRLGASIADVRRNPRPGMVQALIEAKVCGRPLGDDDIRDTLTLLIGGGFDTTTALTAHALEWLGEHPAERDRLRADLPGLIDTATEEFLRYYTPAPGDGRTVTQDYELSGMRLEEGDRLWLSWAMANRDPSVFTDPDTVKIDRKHNRHTSFGLGLHRCIGSNVARAVFKSMLTAVLARMPDYRCDAAGAVHYDTVGVINGMKHLPATFTPGRRQGVGLDETIARWQAVVDEQRLAEPVTRAAQAGAGTA